VPVLGFLDDLLIVPLGILVVVKLIPPELMVEYRAAAAVAVEQPVSRTAMVVIVCVWLLAIALTGWLAWRWFSG
jgi:hypothetical protein